MIFFFVFYNFFFRKGGDIKGMARVATRAREVFLGALYLFYIRVVIVNAIKGGLKIELGNEENTGFNESGKLFTKSAIEEWTIIQST